MPIRTVVGLEDAAGNLKYFGHPFYTTSKPIIIMNKRALPSLVLFTIFVLCVGLFVWRRDAAGGAMGRSTTSESSVRTDADEAGREDRVPSARYGSDRLIRDVPRTRIRSAIESADPSVWSPELSELKNPYVDRIEAIGFLKELLDHEDLQVRIAAAQYLFELGSDSGGPVLRELLEHTDRLGAFGVDPSGVVLVLFQYRYDLDGDDVYDIYASQGDARLLMYAQLMGSEKARAPSRERLLRNGAFQSSAMLAGMMGISDDEALHVYNTVFAKSSRPGDRAQAAWALYMVGGDESYLESLIHIVEMAVGLRERTADYDLDASRTALTALQQTVVPISTTALRRINEAARESGDSLIADGSLSGLFYLHQDYEYVDARILKEFERVEAGKGTGRVTWEIAAERRTSEMVDAAKRANPEAYFREFVLKQGRPVESWVFQYLSHTIPYRVRPPIKAGAR